MYTCSKCGKGVLVEGLKEPIRMCNCTQEVIIDGKTIIKPATITVEMAGTANGKSRFNQR